jgi:molybdopterin synthase catalytic subunit
MSARLSVSVQEADFDFKHEHAQLVSGDKGVGAVVTFIGLVRDLNLADDVVALELEHYPGMTEKSLFPGSSLSDE